MSLILEKCVEFDEVRKICVATENKKTFRIENNSGVRIRKVRVDGCITQGFNEKRCDFLFSIDHEARRTVFFVELKGGALSKALQQLLESIKYLIKEFAGYNIEARIIGSRDVPRLTSLPEYRELLVLVNNNNGTLVRATNNIYTEKV